MTTKKQTPLPISELTLLDFFAAMAMQGLVAADSYRTELVVEEAYKTANAMLAERSKQ